MYLDSQTYRKTSLWCPTSNAGWVMAHLSLLQWLFRGAFALDSLLWLISFIIPIYIMHIVGVGSRHEYGNYFTKSFTETSLSPSSCSLAWLLRLVSRVSVSLNLPVFSCGHIIIRTDALKVNHRQILFAAVTLDLVLFIQQLYWTPSLCKSLNSFPKET